MFLSLSASEKYFQRYFQITRTQTERKKYTAPVNFYFTDAQKKKIDIILEQKWQNLTDFLRGHIQSTIEKYEDKNGVINVYQTYII